MTMFTPPADQLPQPSLPLYQNFKILWRFVQSLDVTEEEKKYLQARLWKWLKEIEAKRALREKERKAVGTGRPAAAEEEGRRVEAEIVEEDKLHAARPEGEEERRVVAAKAGKAGRATAEPKKLEEDILYAARAEKERQAKAAKAGKEGLVGDERRRVEEEIVKEDALYKAICDNKWESTNALLEQEPEALTSKITASGKTLFHVAALFGHVHIMKELLELLVDPQFLERADDFGNTPLLIATVTGITQVAKFLVEKNSHLLAIPDSTNELPVTLAFLNGHIEMGRYLYSQTPLKYLQHPHKDRSHGPPLLRCCLQTQCFDIACHLLCQCPELLFLSDDDDEEWKPIYGIATMSSTVTTPSDLVFWKQWIYDYIDANSTPSFECVSLPIQREDTRERAQGELTWPAGHRLLPQLISSAYNFIGIRKIKQLKLQQAKANEIVELVCKNASRRDQVGTFADALFRATKEGNVEFVVQISKANPEILLIGDMSFRNIIYHAIEHRQASVFNLIHGLRFKDIFATSKDQHGNTLLHTAAKKAPDVILNRIYGPALQMQRELQWFREVERLTPPNFRVLRNNADMTAGELFRKCHADLMKQGEKWIKATASSYSLVGILIVTITFAVAFTLPGGNDQSHGFPLFIKQPTFNVFLLSTIISLVSSSTSVLMFLAILTSPFSEEAFLEFLPSKLLFGVSTLLIAIVTMVITFLSAIRLTIKHTNYHWGILPIILFTSLPISYSLFSLLPVIRNTAFSAYGSVFDRKVGPWP